MVVINGTMVISRRKQFSIKNDNGRVIRWYVLGLVTSTILSIVILGKSDKDVLWMFRA